MFSRSVGREFRVPGSLGVSSRNRYRGQTLGGRVLWDIYVQGVIVRAEPLNRVIEGPFCLNQSKQANDRSASRLFCFLSLYQNTRRGALYREKSLIHHRLLETESPNNKVLACVRTWRTMSQWEPVGELSMRNSRKQNLFFFFLKPTATSLRWSGLLQN